MSPAMLLRMIAWEEGNPDKDVETFIDLYQQLINLGLMDNPDDSHHATALALIELGYCHHWRTL